MYSTQKCRLLRLGLIRFKDKFAAFQGMADQWLVDKKESGTGAVQFVTNLDTVHFI